MFRKSLCLVTAIVLVFAVGATFAADDDVATQEDVAKLKDQVKDLEKRVMKNERKSALDRINFTGDFRFEANTVNVEYPDHFNGMALQKLMVDTMFYMGGTGQMPGDVSDISNFIAQNYSQYQYFTDNLTFDQLKEAVGQMPPEMMQGMMQFLLPHTSAPGWD